MMRFYDVDFGEVLIDGVNIKEYNLHSLRTYISLVMQEPNLMNVSILENILYGNLKASNSEVFEATSIANCNEFIAGKQFAKFDETPSSILAVMEDNEESLVMLLGKTKYDEERDVLLKLIKQDEKQGTFEYVPGDIDDRPASLKDFELD